MDIELKANPIETIKKYKITIEKFKDPERAITIFCSITYGQEGNLEDWEFFDATEELTYKEKEKILRLLTGQIF